ncbi:haloalkane dehalogenase [Parvularcula bermudensis HTCC2503]|uniref:Haloalkane dehalogenase n=1 Tax=Parvularcula bermudensis (strain ATCC BAA-594 / HTCC2503 / KCTC 12087) TaxID=314260 RepID=E0TE73_PARBH|nr:haloalkane dehalogenase [Parvularcula bermudensis]ADM09448.1 haloalkane dehalogenase [Parvularcula bermudensis HTCC2503]
MSIDALRTPDDRFVDLPDYPFAPTYCEDLAGYEGLRLHYVDEGQGPVTFLCLHGEPTWSYLYRKMIPHFVNAGHRVVAPDLFGFGRSDKPVADAVYTFSFHRNALLRFIERLDLSNICLVCQDWGGILGLTLPLDMPERFTRLIVMNTGLPAGEEAPKGFAAWRALNRATPDLDVARLVKGGASILSAAEAEAYAAPFPDQRYKAGVRRFTELVMLRDGDAPLTPDQAEGAEIALRARRYWREDWAGDSFMAIGMKDPVVGPAQMHRLAALIKGCPTPLEIPEGGHFVQEWGNEIAPAALSHMKLT